MKEFSNSGWPHLNSLISLFLNFVQSQFQCLQHFRINTDDLDSDLLEKLKTLYPHKEIEILVYYQDETDYLLSTEANQKHLLEAIARVEKKEGLIDVDPKLMQ